MRSIVARSTRLDCGGARSDAFATARVACGAGDSHNARVRLATALALGMTAAALVAIPARADDIDVYTARIAAQKRPNILFVLDYSGSMNQDIDNGKASDSGKPRKIDELRSAMETVLVNNKSVIRAGIGSIYAGEASGVRWPISDLDVDAQLTDPNIPAGVSSLDVILGQLHKREPGGSTRTVNALVEAALYFRGGEVANGGYDPQQPEYHRPDVWDTSSGTYEGGAEFAAIEASYSPNPAYWSDVFEAGNFGLCRDDSASGGTNYCAGKTVYDCTTVGATSGYDNDDKEGRLECKYEHADAWQGATYNSPIEGTCEANAIVLISDGLPYAARDNASLQSIIGGPASSCEDLSTSIFAGVSADWNGNCGPEVVRELSQNPQIPGIAESYVHTYAVGFNVDGAGKKYLDRLASEGHPVRKTAFSARNVDELNTALAEIVHYATMQNESFADVSVEIDKASFSHDNRAYYSLFAPGSTRGWSGNLKGYFLGDDGLVDTNNQPAVDDDGLAFDKAAQSFWSASADGNDVLSGGASALLAAGGRNLYTFDDSTNPTGDGAELALVDSYRLQAGNDQVTAAQLGVDDTERTAILDWLQTAPMGDPLHSKSVSVAYTDRQVVFVMTNQGLLHAIDATAPSGPMDSDYSGGEELFAFMPGRLLPNLAPLYRGESGDDHIYGLDGQVTRWHSDENNDGIVNESDTVMLVFGMRRGGEAYYAMDVTDPVNPQLKWIIDPDKAGFEDMAQSWSRMSLINVQRNAGVEQVLVFGGGYDAAELDDRTSPRNSRGNAIFVVDRDGSLVRTFGSTDNGEMKYSIAADITPIDSNGDGRADRLYAVDTGGQVWRVDFDNLDEVSEHRVTRLADLDNGKHQPFFGAPSVALNQGIDGEYLSVSIGSGNRTAPLYKDSENAFFMLRDVDVAKGFPSSDFETIKADKLYDATANKLASSDKDTRAVEREKLSAARGWLIKLEKAEKSLTRLVSFDGQLFATTYSPEGTVEDDCDFPSTSRLYRMDIATGIPVNSNGYTSSEDFDPSNPASRQRELEGGSIPSGPSILFPPDSNVGKLYVNRQVREDVPPKLTRVYWHAK